MNLNRSEAKVITLEEFNQGGGGKPPESNDSLWDVFSDKVNDITLKLRKNAREIIRQDLFLLEEIKQEKPLKPTEKQEIIASENKLTKEFNQIVSGGFKGAYLAGKVMMVRKLF